MAHLLWPRGGEAFVCAAAHLLRRPTGPVSRYISELGLFPWRRGVRQACTCAGPCRCRVLSCVAPARIVPIGSPTLTPRVRLILCPTSLSLSVCVCDPVCPRALLPVVSIRPPRLPVCSSRTRTRPHFVPLRLCLAPLVRQLAAARAARLRYHRYKFNL